MRPYISLDIETSGLDLQKSHMLQFGLTYDDGKSDIKNLPTLNLFVDYKYITYGEPYALKMNSWIFEKIVKGGENVVPLDKAIDQMITFIEQHKGRYRMQIAGKNVGSFDIPILRNHMNETQLNRFNNLVQHRTIDVGSIYFSHFGYNPTLDAINKLIGYNAVTHDALDDALNVVYAIRYHSSVQLLKSSTDNV